MLALGLLAIVPGTRARQDQPVVGARSGINTKTGEVPIRRNINSIYQERGPQWDLYIGALKAMYDANETDPLSFFQIAGIHGEPHIAWSGGGPQSGAEAGYCPHNQMLFGTWHRGYLSLFEQTLVQQATRIANNYPASLKKRYVEAAESLRVAYWDWASDSNVPPVTTMSEVTINKPVNGTLRPLSVQNPLYAFKYPRSALEGRFGKFSGTNQTKRCVDEGQSYPGTANANLAGYNLKEKVYNVFLKAESFDEMISAQSEGANFESPHGEVHVGAACGQDLLYLSLSAFEPLFWLHHCNVDRLIAYWQALHFENATMHFAYPSNEMFATPPGTLVTPQSPMYPFMGTEGQPLTSESVAHVRDWGYTYAPIRFWDQAPGETKMEVSRSVNIMYGPQDASFLRGSKSRQAASRREYFAKVEVERGDLELPCQVQLWMRGSLAGTFTLLDMPTQGKSYDEVPLRIRTEAGGTGNFAAEGVLESIHEWLEVVIQKMDGTTMPLDRVPSLRIELEDVEVIQPSSLNELPTIGRTRSQSTKARPLNMRP
ncbi:tyrosinase 2 [Colletotrichum sojae]|uniref:Tyrosinase 2 n=1 Tax=Colletotrichum sojae TaxID=2175907 RepID=A0A8H6J6I2_9PEZI|nr:tyrosinase 2 [Colletotrichum sojae]